MGTWPLMRLTMAAAVSMMGTPAMMRGRMRVVTAAKRRTLKSEMMPSTKPMVSDPESPMKIEAGWKL